MLASDAPILLSAGQWSANVKGVWLKESNTSFSCNRVALAQFVFCKLVLATMAQAGGFVIVDSVS